MPIEDIIGNISIDKIFDYVMDIFFQIVKYPFNIWNNLPDYVRYGVFGIIFLFAIFIAYITWKYRDAWRYFG